MYWEWKGFWSKGKHFQVYRQIFASGSMKSSTKDDVCMYSAGQKKRYDCCFMKKKCQIQMGISQYKNADRLLRNKGINAKD